VKQLVVQRRLPFFLVMGLACFQPPPISRSQRSRDNRQPAPNSATEMRLEAFRMAELHISPVSRRRTEPLWTNGADQSQRRSNMEYALIGVGAAYASSKQDKYLEGFGRGIKWLADREDDERSLLEG